MTVTAGAPEAASPSAALKPGRAAVVGTYLGVFAFWTWRYGVILDREQVLAWLVGGLLVLSLGSGRTAEVLGDWVPLALLLVIYDYSRGAADTLGMPVQFEALAAVERALFFGHVPTVVLQDWLGPFGRDVSARWWEVPVSLVYVSHFVVPFVVPAVLWWRDHGRFRAWIARFLTITAVGLVTYVLVPAAPPWLASRHDVIGSVERTTVRGWAYLDLDIAGRLVDRGQGTVNLVAAFPSLHAAYSALVVVFFWPRAGRLGRALLMAYPVAMGLALVVSGEHYVIDILLGWALAGAACWFWSRREAGRRPGR
jgi:membrane-associated phospholipid phosphatase